MKTRIAVLLALLVAGEARAQLNLSTRGYVGVNERVLIAGFIVSDASYNVLVIRALGPSIQSFGIFDPLANPCIELHDAQGDLVAIQDSYLENTPADLAFLAAHNLTPADPNECAMIVAIAPGQTWTCILAGKWGTQGIALLEGYYFRVPGG